MPDEIRGSDPEWRVEDYSFDFDDIVWRGGELVDLPLEMKVSRVGQHVANVLNEARSCLTVGAELAAAFLSLAVVDYIAGFYRGKETTGADYKVFLADYFPPVYQEHRDWIYTHLRCGLMHNLAAANPWRGSMRHFRITSGESGHLIDTEGTLVFAVDVFLVDIYRAWVMYSHHLVMKADRDGTDIASFVKRFDRLDGQGAFMEKS